MSATAARPAVLAGYDVEALREEFPVLATRPYGKPLVYFDNAATTQKPRAVLDRLARFYAHEYAAIHRGVHLLSAQATVAYEGAREAARRFLNAARLTEVVFVRGATEGINLVAASFARPRLAPGDEILITALEHHSNIVPWQAVCAERGAKLVVAPIDDRGAVILEEFERRLGPHTKLAAVTHVSNALGTINPVAEMIRLAHAAGVPVLVDGAQAAPRLTVDVQALGCDFYVFSGHKTYGPTGIGVLWGRQELLAEMPPYQTGGGMIRAVTFEETLYDAPPARFEAGTPPVAEAIGLGVALGYLERVGLDAIAAWEDELLALATAAVAEVPGLRILGTAPAKAGVLSFVMAGVHPHDIGTILDHEGVAVRAGHHCAQPVMDRFGVPATVRASFGLYNTPAEVETLVRGLARVRHLFPA
ncbi:MAG: SufS family cysteine desulfurase [Acidobacteria bacterium]|nr:SufS family cysteine desulfurase [Thermoanaerobaculia bacterium]NLN10580.1 SufS family cysteine desulfurase [Acidobacteriota bacterium]MBP7813986.1 SufS family cysteine desulfurase [Thermoanaerobaculia bacterium]MBP8844621.1 SufS family cysteine desulfurase [Thermoanaerobaculia bacterium]HPA96694.1 SufS family cysteine desulfurase [Thermoanaerobaculia bacterium]